MAIPTSGQMRVFLKKKICIIDLRTIHFRLNLKARLYRDINCYNIYISIISIIPAQSKASFFHRKTSNSLNLNFICINLQYKSLKLSTRTPVGNVSYLIRN